jgi:hypothetical protein
MRSQIKALQASTQEWRPELANGLAQTQELEAPAALEESLVSDFRADMRPADFVENKFQRALRESSVN